MKTLAKICIIALVFSACKTDKKPMVENQNQDFEAYTQYFIDELWKHNPEWATYVGYHNYDSILTIPNDEYLQKSLAFAKSHLDSLASYDVSQLNPSNQIDYELIKSTLESNNWSTNTLKSHEWNPTSYNVSGLIAFMLNEQYAPLETRLRDISKRMQNIPKYYDAAAKNIKNPVKELTNLAIQQNEGGLYVFKTTLMDSVNQSKLSDSEKSLLMSQTDAALSSVETFVSHLKSILPESSRSFRLGKDLYEASFKYSIQSSYTAEELYNLAMDRKTYLHQKMTETSAQLWSKYYGNTPQPKDSLELISKVISKVSETHVKPEEFQSAIEAQIPELEAFVKEKNLLYIDPSKPLVVRKEPAYMAGVAGASISAPGPYDKDGNTYYNVGSLEGWPADKAESYLREYNHYMLQILNIHEAIPGHYTQLVYANKSPSLIKSILANGAMIEGWAVYTEQMMLENGYGNNEPEMWLMWYKWNLRTVCNTILDYSVHVKNMSKEEAIHLLVKEAFQEQAEADGKWNRVNVSSVQLTSYFAGFVEIVALREKLKEKQGDAFDLKAFHEQFLSYGNAPVKDISRLMLEEK